MRLTILGGGGFRVPLIYRAIVAAPACPIDEVVLFDDDPGRLAVIASVLEPHSTVRIRITDSLLEALTGTDVVFSAIRVGGAGGRVRDERRALALGVLGQETVGAGGLAFGLRTLPVVLRAARLQADLAPDTWLINFTNPAGMITQALTTVLGERVIGICDSPTGLVRRACRALGISAGEVRADYAGINHLGWLTGLHHRGVDRLPELLQRPDLLAGTEEGRLFGPVLIRSLRSIPNEYLYFYYAARELVAGLSGRATRGEVIQAQQHDFYEAAAAHPEQAAGLWQRSRNDREQTYLAEARDTDRDGEDLTGGGYENVALDIVGAVLADAEKELIVNARNGSAYPQLPPGMVVETRCLVGATGARPQPGPVLSLHQLGLVASVRAAEESIIAAAVDGDRDAAVHGFAIHPLIGSARIADDLVTSLTVDEPAVATLFEHRRPAATTPLRPG